MNKKNILYFIGNINLAGLETVVMRIANSLDKTKFNVHICVVFSVQNDALSLLNENIMIHTLTECDSDFQKMYFFRKILTKYEIDIVHSHNWVPLSIAFPACKLSRNIRHIHTEHGRDLSNPSYSSRQFFVRKLFYSHISLLTFVSQDLRQYFHTSYGLPISKLSIIKNGVSYSKYRIGEGDFVKKQLAIPAGCTVVGTVAYPRPVKNLMFLSRVIHKLIFRGKNVLFLLIGEDDDGSYLLELKTFFMKNNIDVNSLFLGRRTDVANILPAIDIYVNSSSFEGISCSILEAMASGLPIVASNVGGNPELVEHNHNGFLFNENDEESCLSFLCQLIDDPCLLRKMGRASRLRVESEFSLETQLAKYQQLYA